MYKDHTFRLVITAILPQHGCIFRGEEVSRFTQWLGQFPVGADYFYPDLA